MSTRTRPPDQVGQGVPPRRTPVARGRRGAPVVRLAGLSNAVVAATPAVASRFPASRRPSSGTCRGQRRRTHGVTRRPPRAVTSDPTRATVGSRALRTRREPDRSWQLVTAGRSSRVATGRTSTHSSRRTGSSTAGSCRRGMPGRSCSSAASGSCAPTRPPTGRRSDEALRVHGGGLAVVATDIPFWRRAARRHRLRDLGPARRPRGDQLCDRAVPARARPRPVPRRGRPMGSANERWEVDESASGGVPVAARAMPFDGLVTTRAPDPSSGKLGRMGFADVARELLLVAPADFVAERTVRQRSVRKDDRALATAIGDSGSRHRRVGHRPAGARGRPRRRGRPRARDPQGPGGRRPGRSGSSGVSGRVWSTRSRRPVPTRLGRGHPVTRAVLDQVRTTIEAAMADPHAGAAVRSGLLVRALESAGFDAVDLDGALADPDAVPDAWSGSDAPPISITSARGARKGSRAPDRPTATASHDAPHPNAAPEPSATPNRIATGGRAAGGARGGTAARSESRDADAALDAAAGDLERAEEHRSELRRALDRAGRGRPARSGARRGGGGE